MPLLVAAGALFRDAGGRVLLVKPHYKAGWEIPGGMVEPGETPSEACAREVTEELGQSGQVLRLCAANKTVREVLDLTDLAGLFDHFEDATTAVRSFL